MTGSPRSRACQLVRFGFSQRAGERSLLAPVPSLGPDAGPQSPSSQQQHPGLRVEVRDGVMGAHDNNPATVTLCRFTRSGGDTMQPNREPVGELKTNGASPNAVPAEGQIAGGAPAELHDLLQCAAGDARRRLLGAPAGRPDRHRSARSPTPSTRSSPPTSAWRSSWSASARSSARRARPASACKLGLSSGAWGEMENSVNTLIDDLLWPTTEVTRAIAAVAQGRPAADRAPRRRRPAAEGRVPALGHHRQHDDQAAQRVHLGGDARGARGRHRRQARRPGAGAAR